MINLPNFTKKKFEKNTSILHDLLCTIINMIFFYLHTILQCFIMYHEYPRC